MDAVVQVAFLLPLLQHGLSEERVDTVANLKEINSQAQPKQLPSHKTS